MNLPGIFSFTPCNNCHRGECEQTLKFTLLPVSFLVGGQVTSVMQSLKDSSMEATNVIFGGWATIVGLSGESLTVGDMLGWLYKTWGPLYYCILS